jgi:small-conductance mechanosensitive channel
MRDARGATGGRAMYLFLGIVGVVSSVALELVGLRAGDAGELPRILGIACFAMAAAAYVGLVTDDGARAPRSRVRVSAVMGNVFAAICLAPFVLISTGVLLLSFLPALYFMYPFFAGRVYGPAASLPPRSRRRAPRVPAYA